MTEQAWNQKDLERNPHAAEDKPSRVRRMFEAIAPAYDLNTGCTHSGVIKRGARKRFASPPFDPKTTCWTWPVAPEI